MNNTSRFDNTVDSGTSRFMMASILAMAALSIPAAVFQLGWKSATVNTALFTVLYTVYICRTRNRLLMGLAALGLVAGFVELAADWWLVNKTQTLFYAPDEPLIVVSPLYMPFAWALIIFQGGFIAAWLRQRIGTWKAAVVTALFCAVNIPLYEHLAADANWWVYKNTPQFFNTPYYIILGEFLLGLPLAFMVAVILSKRRTIATAAVLGLVEGIVILVAYMIAWYLVGPCHGAVIQFAC